MDLTSLTVPELSFYYHFYGSDIDRMYVDATTDGMTWTSIDTIIGQQMTASSDPWAERTVVIPASLSSATTSIRFRGVRGASFAGDMSIDLFNVREQPACASPSGGGIDMITSNSARMFWTEGNAGSPGWVLEYGAPGFTIGTGTVVSSSNDTATISGLMGNTDYCVYYSEICPGGADTSAIVGPVCFRTACSAYGVPYSEDFSGSPLDPCWSTSNTAGSTAGNAFWKLTDIAWPNYSAQGQTDHTGNGGYAVGVDASSPYDASMDSVLLFSPDIIIAGTPNLELSFYMFSEASAYKPAYQNNIITVAGKTNTG